MKELEEIKHLVLAEPNDFLLGEKVRALIINAIRNTNSYIKCFKCGSWNPRINHDCQFCNKPLKND